MGTSTRRHPEDSVVVSMGQVHDLLRQDSAPPAAAKGGGEAARELPVARPVTPAVVPGVPSINEVRASRAARWKAGAPSSLSVVPTATRAARWPWIVLGAAVAVAAGAGGFLFGQVDRDVDGVPLAPALQLQQQIVDAAVLAGRLRATEEALGAARADVAGLRESVARLEGDLAAARQAAVAQETPAEVVEAPSPPKRVRPARRVTSRPRAAGAGPARPRAPRSTPRGNRTDRTLDALIDGL